VFCDRKAENGDLVFAIPAARGDVPQPWVNPFTALGPVGALCQCTTARLSHVEPNECGMAGAVV